MADTHITAILATVDGSTAWGTNMREAMRTLKDRTRIFPVTEFGAVGGSTTIGAGAPLTAAQTDTGQAWLTSTATLDLIAFYKAQVAADAAGGGTIVFPNLGTDYEFSHAGFVHSYNHVRVEGNIRMTGDGTLFTRSNDIFLFGILAREDYPRFAAQGWQFTADDIVVGATSITTVSGGTYAAGDAVMIRSTTEDATEPTRPIPTVSTFNIVRSFAGGTLVLEHPMEQAVVDPLIINYTGITTLKSALVGTGEPHRYYCAVDCSLTGPGKLIGLNNQGFRFLAAHGLNIDIELDCPDGSMAYGGGLIRSTVKTRGRWGGLKNVVELGTGSSLSTIECDGRWSGRPPGAGTETDYDMILIGERTFQCHIKARLRGYTKIYAFALRAGGISCTYDLDIESEGIASAGVCFVLDATATGGGNVVRGRLKSSSCGYHADFAGTNDTLRDMVFEGVPTTDAIRFRDANNGRVLNCFFPSGKPVFTGTTGNVISGGYVHSPPTATTGTGRIQTTTQFGPFPNAIQTATRSSSGTIGYDQAWGTMQHNTGAAGVVTVTLPVAVVGMSCRFIRNNATQAMRIDPSGSQTIGNEAAGKYLSIDTDNGYLEVVCSVANKWAIAGSSGTISVEP